MPFLRCIFCGKRIGIDEEALPYKAQVTCPDCDEAMLVNMGAEGEGTTITRAYLYYDDMTKKRKVWRMLLPIEKKAIKESARAYSVQAYTACELMAFRTLESVLRRIYKEEKTLGHLIRKMENDDRLADLQGIVSYFKDERNKVAHPGRLSTELDAKSTFEMTKRLLIQIIEKIPKF